MPVNNLIQLRRGSDWSTNPVLSSGEPGFDIPNNQLKIGDGSTVWSGLTPVNYNLNNYSITGVGNINISGNLTANSGIFTSLQIDGDTIVAYSAGSGLELNNYIFNAKTATTSVSGITILSNAISSDDNKALTPKAIYDAGYADGSGTSNYLAKWSDSNTLTSGIIYDDGTNVGIGTASPVEKLYVNGSIGNLGWRINEGAITTTGSGVGNGVAITLNAQFGTTLTTTFQYKVRLTTYGTATNTGATYLVHYNTSTSAWVLREVGLEGNTSNHPLLAESDGELIAYTNNATGYGIRYLVESYNTADADSTPNSMGADYHWQRLGNNLYYVDGNVSIGTTTTINRLNVEGGNIVFNDLGGNYDFRVEGDADPNLLFTDASADRVGIGTASPQAKLDVNGTVQFNNLVRWEYPDKALDANIGTLGYLRTYDETGGYCGLGTSTSSFNIGTSGAINLRFIGQSVERARFDTNGNFIFNEAGNNCDFRVEGDTDPNLLFTDASTDRVGIGTDSPTNKLTVIGAASFGTLERTPNNADAAGFYNRIEAGGGTQTTKSYGSIWLYNSNNTQTHSFHSYPGTDNYINNGGNFGIGTSSPSYKLDITGDIGLTNGGFYTSPTGTILGTNGWIYQSGQVVNSQGSFSSSGDSQSSQYILRTSTTNNTWTPVKNNGSNAILLASNRTYSFSINIVARRTNGQDNAGYKLEGVLYNDGYGADFVGSPTKTVLAESDSTWDVRVSISGAGAGGTDYLLTEVLGASSKNINWAVKADLLEVGGNISSYTEANALSLDDEFIP